MRDGSSLDEMLKSELFNFSLYSYFPPFKASPLCVNEDALFVRLPAQFNITHCAADGLFSSAN